jgi:phage shock protein A
MFNRFIRALKSLFGGFVSSIEDPKLILEQNIRELNDQIPKMNENIATVKANLMMLQKELKKYEKQVQDLTSKIKSAIQAGRDDIAENYALQLEKAKESLAGTKEQVKFAEAAYDKALQVKKAFLREKDRKIQEAKEALRDHERSQWQAKVADTLESFEVGGMDHTHGEMISRLNEQTAKNEARMELALDSVDTQSMEIEMNAEKLRAHELIQQFKADMNAEDNKESAPAAPSKPLLDQMDDENSEAGKDKEGGSKTIGRERA